MSAGRWSDSGSLSADLDGWDVASTGSDMLAGWDDDPTLGPETGEATETDSPHALSDEWHWGDSREDEGEDGAVGERAASSVDDESAVGESGIEAMEHVVRDPRAAVDSLTEPAGPNALGATASGSDDVDIAVDVSGPSISGDADAASDSGYKTQWPDHAAESLTDAGSPVDPDSTMGTPATPAGFGPSLASAAGGIDEATDHPALARPENQHGDSERAAGSATGRLTPPMTDSDDRADGLRSAPLFDVPVINPPADHAPMERRGASLTPVSEPPLMAGDDEEDGLQMFLGDEQDYVLEQDLRNKTRAEAAARNAFRMHRPPVRSAGPVPASESVVDGGEGWDYGDHAAPSGAGDYGYSGQPTPDHGLGGLEAARSVDAMRTVGDGTPVEDAGFDDAGATESAGDRGPALDYDDLLNEMNAGSDDYMDLDSPAVLEGDEEEDLNGSVEVDGDEVNGRLAYAEHVASLSKSRPSAGGADIDGKGSAGVDDDGDEPADADNESGEPDGQEDSAGSGSRLRKIRGSIGGKLHALMVQAKSEIGAGADDSPVDSEPDSTPASSPGKKRKRAVEDSPSAGSGKGKSVGVLGAFDAVLRKIRAVRRSWRIASAISLVLVGLWTSLNIPVAVDKGGANGAAVDEGSVKVAAARWTGSGVEVTLRNDSEMVAHVAGSAVVRSWSPSASPVSWIGARVTATCELPATDVDPGKSATVSSSKCDAEPTGIWHRVKATLEYE